MRKARGVGVIHPPVREGHPPLQQVEEGDDPCWTGLPWESREKVSRWEVLESSFTAADMDWAVCS